MSPRARYAWAVGALPAPLGLLAALVVADAAVDRLDLPWWAWPPLALAVPAYAGLVAQWRYVVHRWEVTDTAVYTQTGWWARERRIAPVSRIQTVDHVQGPLDRVLGLATVTVTTASAAGALPIPGLEVERARALAEELTARADAAPGDAT